MKDYSIKAASAMIILSGAIASGAEPTTSEIITEMAETISESYVFPDVGEQVSEMLLGNLKSGEYDELAGRELADTLEDQIRNLTHDLHFGVRSLPPNWTPPTEGEDAGLRQGPSAPYGFNSVERLGGNIGYIDLRGFNNANSIGETVDAVMRLVQGSSSIIFDLRRNGGGDPDAVALISSYLFEPSKSIHLNSLYSRPRDETTEYWTHADIDTTLAMPDTPVYVLTSRQTFSAAEEFTYNLKNLERATIIGETTGGGAHPVDQILFSNDETDRHYLMILPTARAINPISGTNWEGTGVAPDFEVSADDALNVAIGQILQTLADEGDEGALWELVAHNAYNNPHVLSKSELGEYAGQYTDRELMLDNGELMYRRIGNPNWSRLIAAEKDIFVIDGFDGFQMHFERDSSGAIEQITGHYQQGRVDYSIRE